VGAEKQLDELHLDEQLDESLSAAVIRKGSQQWVCLFLCYK
jgi:hypothetical protein